MLKDDVHKQLVDAAEEMFKTLWPAIEVYDSKLTANSVKQSEHDKLILDAVNKVVAMQDASMLNVAKKLKEEAKELKHE